MADIINNRFILFEKRAAFNTALTGGKISPDSIVFIKDQQKIWSQGAFFNKAAFSKYKVGETTYEASNDSESIINFLSSGDLSVSADNTGNITYSYTHPTWEGDNVTTGAGEFIKSITFDARGHVVSVAKEKISCDVYDIASEKNLTDGAKISITKKDAYAAKGTQATVVSSISINGAEDDKISVTSNANGDILVAHDKAAVAVKVESNVEDNQVSVLGNIEGDAWGHLISATQVSVPTKAYVDSEVEKLEVLVGTSVDAALILKGVVSSDADLPKTAYSGYTYKVAAEFESLKVEGEKQLRAGDVIICVGSDKVDGKETGANPKWAAIQSNVDLAGKAFGLVKDSVNATNAEDRIYGVKVENGIMTVNVPAQHIPTVSSKNVIEAAKDAEGNVIENKAVINHIDVIDNEESDATSSHSISGSNAAKVSVDDSGNITIDATDTYVNTTYAYAAEEGADVTKLIITPTITTTVNGVSTTETGDSVTVSFNAWAYPDKQQEV